MRARRLKPLFDNIEIDRESCWMWSGPLCLDGYGLYSGTVAHRVTYELFRGPIPESLQLDHLCRNRPCVNPWHLEPVTALENTLRRVPRKTCPKGHDVDIENTIWSKRSDDSPTRWQRRCRICSIASGKVRDARRKVRAKR